jgi:hypothetical protein
LTGEWHPIAMSDLPATLAAWLDSSPGASGVVRVAVDGPPCADPDGFAATLAEPLRALGRPTQHVLATTFWRDASLRLEYGHEDVESYLSWLDADALRREVLVPAVEQGQFLPSLRDPDTNRSTRAEPRALEPTTVLIVSGSLLLGLGLPFDRVVHLHLPPDARERRTPPDQAWTLPAFDEYDETVGPLQVADVVVRLDRRTPAVQGLPERGLQR